MKNILNLGCGNRKTKDALNVDVDSSVGPDVVYDLNVTPWKFFVDDDLDDVFDEVIARYVIEHLERPDKIMKEIHKVTKNKGIVKIYVTHKSGTANYDDITHRHYFTCGTFMGLVRNKNWGFKLRKIKLNYFVSDNDERIWYRIINNFVSFFANFLGWYSIRFCERIWCYWVGGFDEIYVEFEVVK